MPFTWQDRDLVSFVCHSGSLMGGHYYAYVNFKGKWYCANDNSITPADRDEVETQMRVGYMFFYSEA